MKRRNFLSAAIGVLCAPLGMLGFGRKDKTSPCLLPEGQPDEEPPIPVTCLIWTGKGDGKSFKDPANWRPS